MINPVYCSACSAFAQMQFAPSGDIWTNLIWFAFFIVFMLFYPRIVIAQTLFRLELSAQMLEGLTRKAKAIVVRQITRNPSPKLRQEINNFLEFFVISPVSVDPYGIIKKIEHVMDLSEERFKYFVDQIAPKMDEEMKQNIKMGLSGAISLNEVSKQVRHFVELIRKTKNLQLALILQMQLPMIERISKALLDGTEALSHGWTIGDSAGSFVAAHMAGSTKMREIEEDVMLASKTVAGRRVLILKAKGPGGRLGKIGKAVEKLVKRNRGKVSKIITVDAAAKLEGEKTGSIAQGVGVALGGVGVDRSYIENVAVNKKIPLDSIVVKMAEEEAIQPIKPEIVSAIPKVQKLVEDDIRSTKGKGVIIIVGVGNSSGVGDSKAAAQKAEQLAKRISLIVKKREKKLKEEEKKNWLKKFFLGG